jgi:hypothetical protein
MEHHTTIPYHTILLHTILYHTTPYCTIPYHTTTPFTKPYHTILYHTQLRCISLKFILSYYTSIPYYNHILTYPTIPITPYHISLFSPHHTIPCHTIPYHTIPYHTIPCLTKNWNKQFSVLSGRLGTQRRLRRETLLHVQKTEENIGQEKQTKLRQWMSLLFTGILGLNFGKYVNSNSGHYPH